MGGGLSIMTENDIGKLSLIAEGFPKNLCKEYVYETKIQVRAGPDKNGRSS